MCKYLLKLKLRITVKQMHEFLFFHLSIIIEAIIKITAILVSHFSLKLEILNALEELFVFFMKGRAMQRFACALMQQIASYSNRQPKNSLYQPLSF